MNAADSLKTRGAMALLLADPNRRIETRLAAQHDRDPDAMLVLHIPVNLSDPVDREVLATGGLIRNC